MNTTRTEAPELLEIVIEEVSITELDERLQPFCLCHTTLT